MIGSRVVKTCIAVALSILIARSLHLQSPQFAGIVAVLSVQPTLTKTLRNGLLHIISAILGALVGAVALYFFGNSFLVMGIVTFVLMTLHVKIKWTSSLLLAVVIAINAMGSISLFFGASGINQMGLVLIGTVIGMMLNFFHKPIHQERAEVLVSQSEGMLRALLYYLFLDLQENKVTPLLEIRKQIDEVHKYIERGKEIAKLIDEDARFRSTHTGDMRTLFQTFEQMVESIQDFSKSLQHINPANQDLVFLKKTLLLIIHLQENKMNGKPIHASMVDQILQNRIDRLWERQHLLPDHATLVAFHQLYAILQVYLHDLHSLKQIDLDISTNYYPEIDGLKDEISALVVVSTPLEKRELRTQKS
jgi:uncharacterized membrane protein YgaE (UPF0421/DUF939 family)